MGWTIQYKATTPNGDIEAFVQHANSKKLKLSWFCEEYRWEVSGENSATGFTKVAHSLRPKRDYLRILTELIKLSSEWPHVKVNAGDDYVLGDWWNVKNVKIDKLEI